MAPFGNSLEECSTFARAPRLQILAWALATVLVCVMSGCSLAPDYTCPALPVASFSLPFWEFDFGGRVRNLKEAQLEQFLATDAARRAVTISLVANVADTYLSLRELDERIVIE